MGVILKKTFYPTKKEDLQTPQLESLHKEEPYEREIRQLALESRELVPAKKHMETLEGLLKAYQARLKANETIEQRWRRYPDPVGEKRQLELYRCLVEATQALLEKVSQSQLKEKGDLGPKTQNIKERGPDRHPLKTLGEKKSSQESPQEPNA